MYRGVWDSVRNFLVELSSTKVELFVIIFSNVALPFEWMVVKPHISPVEESEDDNSSLSVARTLDVESPFSIEPQNGVLEASGIANFHLTFAPPEVAAFIYQLLPLYKQYV